MPHQNLKAPDVPDWFRHVANDSYLTARDIIGIFGFASTNSLHGAVSRGFFPKPTRVSLRFDNGHGLWLVSTIRKEIARRKKLKNET